MSESNDNISAPGPLRIPGWMIAGCAVTWTVAIAAAVWTLPVLHMPLRAAVALLLIGMAVSVLRSSSRPLILSPLYLLALFAFTAYSLLLLIFAEFLPLPPAVKAIVEYTFEAFGGLGEMLVLQFSAFCLTLSALAWRKFPLSGHTVHTDFTERPWTLAAIGSTGLVIVLSSIPLLGRQWPWLGEFLTTGIGLQIHDALPPLTSVCIITLAYIGAVRKGRYLALVAAVVVFYLTVKLTTELAQIPVFIALSALLLVGAVGFTGLR